MQNNSKTFRLFISSTFSDFQKEREVLQTKVFPKIKEYCSSNGYTFQPIDLRWGVSNEAQLDQKALEMCINEVQSCKTHDYPNFLIMIGDRYGWIPLPNIIEKNEFEQILQNLDIEDKEYLSSWYYEDSNQIPISYILKQRINEYEDFELWQGVENRLRDILKVAVSDLDENIKKKYFTSATEAEAIEGIISYSQKSEFQQKLIKLIPNLEQVDHKNIFGFFRNINKDKIIEDKFISVDYNQAQSFKQQVQEKLIDENILNVSTTQISKDQLEETYIDTFIESVINFLKQQIDKQISRDKEKDYSDLEIEKLQQQFFMNQKLENFLGQEKILDEILNYISDENDKPLIICGQSGIGKSSIMAKAIEETSIQTSKKIVYRFIGATPNSTNTKDLLTSILEELNITLENNNTTDDENYLLTDIDKEENAFVDFSNNVYDETSNITDNIVIFIDAVDQLTNDDQFLWLPNKLPSNIKIVISALKDGDYKEDSKYFYILEDKISSYIEIEPFGKPIELIELLLSQQKRTLQVFQQEYFLEQYNQVKTPLFVYMASNQMQYWKSGDIVDTNVALSLSQKDIVKSFIENLTLIHHHDKPLVQKVFGYLLASKDGLSEYEILELLNTDKEFIKSIAPDTWYINTTQELPLVIWTRLHNHIKPFLSTKNKDGQELLYFFHREFIDAIENQINQQKEHEKIIEATQKLIVRHQDQEFDSNRWGKIFATLLVEYFFEYEEEIKIKIFCEILLELDNDNWLISFIQFLQEIGWRLNTNNKFNKAFADRKVVNLILSLLNIKSNKWLYLYVQSSHNLASTLYSLKQIDNAINIEKKNIDIIENLTDNDSLKSIEFMKYFNSLFKNEIKSDDDFKGIASLMWTDSYLKTLSVLSSSYSEINQFNKAIEIDKKSCNIAEFLYKAPHNNGKFFTKHYLTALGNLAESHYKNDEKNDAIVLQKKALEIVKKEYDSTTGYLVEDYTRILNGLSVFLAETDPLKSSELSEKSQQIISKLSEKNNVRYSAQESNIASNQLHTLCNKITSLSKNKDLENLKKYLAEIEKTLQNIIRNNDDIWIKNESDTLFILFGDEYKNGNLEEATVYLMLNTSLLKVAYENDNDLWAVDYVQRLIANGKYLQDYNEYKQALSFQIESYKICEKYFDEYHNNWGDLLTKTLNNLSTTYIHLNQNKEALNVSKMNLDISIKLFQKKPSRWLRAYYYALHSIVDCAKLNGDHMLESKYKNDIKVIESKKFLEKIENLSKDVYEEISKNKSTGNKIKYFDYIFNALLLLGVYFFIKYIF